MSRTVKQLLKDERVYPVEKREIDPIQYKLYEHWFVSEWLAENLEARGEKIKRHAGIMWARKRPQIPDALEDDPILKEIAG